uniref:NADH-ubiquinone oxidoreductase chain 4L n=1 Tax=Coleoptera sp. 22 KM-2017 TaxID=2219326 RepID=A0A346RIX0_9COLE|nr:NADH dehydrogenase subunit 4L [Coleoptera sp. 22 KM-2017]
MDLFFGIVICMYILGLFSFGYKNMHFLLMLLSLEFLAMVIFFGLVFLVWNLDGEMYVLVYYLIFCVCEGSLGLSILVCMVRSFGNDYVSSLNVLKC